MYVKAVIILVLLETVDITYTTTTTTRANKLIQNICDSLYNDKSLQLGEDKQWELLCRELRYSKDDDQKTNEHNTVTEQDTPSNNPMPRAAIRVSVRGSGSRTSGIRTSGGSSGSRTSSSITRYRNTRTGASISRPNGWQWSRSGLIFLPLATRYFHRSRSSSNRYTTPSTSSVTYYYCTSNIDDSIEIQCSSTYGDTECCEDPTTQAPFCCGGSIPDDILQDMNRAARTIARVFYTLAAMSLCVHLFMQRFYR